MDTLQKLLAFLTKENSESGTRVRVACGHETDAGDGEEIVRALIERIWEILDGNAVLEDSFEEKGDTYDRWGFARFTVLTPRRLVEDAKNHFKRGVTST